MARRSGYTLIEVVMVMAIMVIVGALTIPLADALINPNRLTAARDLVRGNLAEMRGRAMSEGRAYRFQIQEHTGFFKIEPADANNLNSPGWTHQDELPEPILFMNGNAGPGTSGMSGSDWQTVVIYLPDGSAQDSAEIRFSLNGQRPLVIQVRDLTGAISTPEPGQEAEMQP